MPAIKITWIDSISAGVTNHLIYRDDVLLGIVSMGVQEYIDYTALDGVSYKYEVQASGPLGQTATETDGVNVDNIIVTTLTPILTNFTIEDTNKDRVYFSTPLGYPDGMTTTGFVISGNTITGVTKVSDSSGYFTVSVPFTFWDNNTIRLGENSDDFNGTQVNTTVDNFTLTYIENNIPEPSASTNRYVAVGGTGDGTSEGNAASLSYMVTNAVAGQTWWIKAGNYGTATISLTTDGTTDNPIKYIGYKTTIGDITENYLKSSSDIINNWSDTEWPTFVGTDSGTSITVGGDYLIIRNLQSRSHQYSMQSSNSASNVLIERFNQKDNDISTSYSGISLTNAGSNRIRIKETQSLDIRASGVLIQSSGGGFHLIENNGVYTSAGQAEYYISASGSNSIIRKNIVSMPTELSSKHGIGIKATGTLQDNNWNLIELNQAYGMAESYYVRNNRTYYNVIKDNYAEGANQVSARQSGGIYFWGGSRYNIVERNLIKNMGSKFIQLQDNNETPSHDEVGAYNIVRNNIFDTSERRLLYSSSDVTSAFNDNKFYNNTFINAPVFYNDNYDGVVVTDLQWKNNIFINIGNPVLSTSGMTFGNNIFNLCGTWADTFIGSNGNVDLAPSLDANYVPSNELAVASTLAEVLYDYNSEERNSTETTIGGVMLLSEVVEAPTLTPDYYVSTSGSDSNDGTTELTAWQTITKVETEITSADAGKVIAFERGGEWNDLFTLNGVSGTLGNEITFTSYGTGDFPIIHDKTEGTLSWTNVDTNIWKATVSGQMKRLEVDGIERLGGPNMLYSQLGTTVPDLVSWWYGDNGTDGTGLYYYSASDPSASVFTYSSTPGDNARSALFIESDYLVFHQIDFRGGYSTAVTVYGCDNVKFDDCKFGYMSQRGIDFLQYSSVPNTKIEVSNCDFDTKFTFDYTNLGTYSSAEFTGGEDAIYTRGLNTAIIHNNNFKNWGHSSVSISSQGAEVDGYVSKNIKIYDNTFTQEIAYGRGFGMSGNSFDNEIYNNEFINNPTPIQVNGYNNNFHDNIIRGSFHGPLKAYQQAALVLQGYALFANNNIIEYNSFIDCENPGLGIDGQHNSCNVEDNIIRNNIFDNCGTVDTGLSIDLKVDEAGGFDAINNSFLNNSISSPLSTLTINDNGTTRTVATWNGTTTKGNTVTGNTGLGAELVSNGDFSNGSTGWTIEGGGGSSWVVTDVATRTSSVNWGLLQTLSVTSGSTYRVEFDVVTYTSGTLGVRTGDAANSISVTSSGLGKSFDITWGSTDSILKFSETFVGVIDNISVREVL